MQVIPVIDLKEGAVVQARGGVRARYEPVRSRLCAGSDPLEVVRALLDVFAFSTLYVADLAAIDGAGDQAAVIVAIERAFPALELWIDSGLRDAEGCAAWRTRSGATPVIGTETLRDAAALRELHALVGPGHWVLSLDHRDDRPLGDTAILDDIECWPRRVIVLALDRVGMGSGPDFRRLETLTAKARTREIYAGGGIRDGADLERLARIGVSGALVATALHERRLGRAEIAAVATGPACW